MRRLALLACGALVLGACHAPPEAKRGPRPLADLAPKPAYVVSQAAVDRAIPAGVDAYEASQITWEGTVPTRVVLERFVRGKCYLKERLTESDDGRFELSRIPGKGAATGGPAKPGLVILAALLDGPAGRGQATVQRDPLGRIAWVYVRHRATARGRPAREVITRLRYEVHGCVLPRVLDRGEIPPKLRPAGIAPPPPGAQ